MKKSLIIFWFCIIVIAFVACGKSQEETKVSKSPQTNTIQSNASGIEAKEIVSPIEDFTNMFNPCSQLVAYMAVSNEEIDMLKPTKDDFWLIMSMVTYAAKPDSVGEFGTIDLKENQVSDIAEGFFSEMLKKSEIPSTKETYSAAYIGAEELYELQPMSISGINAELISLEKADNKSGRYIMKIRICDDQESTTISDWCVYLDAWDDNEEHFFPYKFVKAWYTT